MEFLFWALKYYFKESHIWQELDITVQPFIHFFHIAGIFKCQLCQALERTAMKKISDSDLMKSTF